MYCRSSLRYLAEVVGSIGDDVAGRQKRNTGQVLG